ncbi:hypothetical protein ACOMHN_015320 [Nucella lapillus]
MYKKNVFLLVTAVAVMLQLIIIVFFFPGVTRRLPFDIVGPTPYGAADGTSRAVFRLSPPVSRLSPPVSRLSPPVSRLSPPVSRLSPPVSRLSLSVSRLSPPVSRLSPPVSRLPPPVSRLSPPVSRLSLSVSRLSPPVSRLSPPVSRLSLSVSRLSPPVSRLSLPVSRLSHPVSRLSPPVSRLSPPVSRLSPPVSNSSTDKLTQLYLNRYNTYDIIVAFDVLACDVYANDISACDVLACDVSACAFSASSACWFPDCDVSFPPLLERLQQVIQTQHPLTRQQKSVVHYLSSFVQYFDVVFITAASSNHFGESQGVIQSLHEVVFPELERQGLWTFHLYYYDLGLKKEQLRKLKKHCRCTVLPFPFSRLPEQFHRLRSCIWKPLLMKAHLNSSRFTLWMDASTSFTARDITPILHQASQLGIFVTQNNYMALMHTHPSMLSYFHVKPCSMASFYEIAGGFVALNNDEFVHKAILDPWVSCAFSQDCLCPMTDSHSNCVNFVKCTKRKQAYFRCHRFDQSALVIILSLLFDWRMTHLTHRLTNNTITTWFSFMRGGHVQYFP